MSLHSENQYTSFYFSSRHICSINVFEGSRCKDK